MNAPPAPISRLTGMPVVGSRWVHFDGCLCTVLDVCNLHTSDPDVLYVVFDHEGVGKCACSLADWRVKMRPASSAMIRPRFRGEA